MNCLDSSFVVDFLDPEQDHHDAATGWMRERSDAGDDLAEPDIDAYERLLGAFGD